MIEELIRQLKNPDPDVRKRAIMALGKAKDPTALKALAEVVRGDPDPTLRELALKAGQYIRQQTKKSTRGPQDKDLPTTGMLIRKTPAKAAPPPPPAPPLRRSERKALAANPPPPPLKKIVRPLEDTGELPETGALLGNIKPAAPPAPKAAAPPPPAPPAPKAPSSLLSNIGKVPAPPPKTPSVSPFTSESDSDDSDDPSNLSDEEARTPLYGNEEDDLDFLPDLGDDAPPKSAHKPITEQEEEAEPNFPLDLADDEPIEPLRAPPLYFEKEAPAQPAELQPFIKGSSIVKGRKYNVSKDDETRAHAYVNAALSMNLEGDNAKAMKNLTQAISLNPNLINDGFFSNVAASVTGLEGDAAAQMIIDRNERKRFTDDATRKQKGQRVEKHLTEAKQSVWADVGFDLGIYAAIVIIGSIASTIFANEGLKQLVGSFDQLSKGMPEQLQNSQASLSAITLGSLLPSAIISGISAVAFLLLQTVIIHFLAKALGGIGTWRHLIHVLVGFYNRWILVFFVILSLTAYITFVSGFSPVALCPTIILIILALYIAGSTSSKVGVAYDFGGAKGCITVTLSSVVIALLSFALSYALFQSISATIGKITPG